MMYRYSFFEVIKNNLKCAFCRKKDCTVRFSPGRRKEFFYGGTKFVLRCQKSPSMEDRWEAIANEDKKWRKK